MDQRELSKLLPLNGEPLPFRFDESGVVRIGSGRTTLDLIVEQYENGMTPEDMARAYDTLVLADVHAAIAYYLRHQDEVQMYLMRRREEAEELRAQIETERPPVCRDNLIARRVSKEAANAPSRK